MQILHKCRKFMQIRYQKGTGTKMHKCLYGPNRMLSQLNHLHPEICNSNKSTIITSYFAVEIFFLINLKMA